MKPQKPDFKKIKYLINNSVAALLLGAAILFYGCENNLEEIKAFSYEEALPTLEAVNFETMYTDSGTIRYFLKAPRLLKFENEGKEFVEFPDGMEIMQYDANQVVVSSLTADYAKQFVKEQTWEAKNNVVATNQAGDTLKTDHLIWEEKTKLIHTEEYVEIIRTDGVYTGVGLTADESLEKWRIKKLKGIVDVTVDKDKKAKEQVNETQPNNKTQKNKPFKSPVQLKK